MLNKIKNEGVVAVIRAKDHEEALGYINACLNGGIKAIELTYTIPNVVELIKHVSENYKESVFRREKIMATDLGNNIAIPHGSEKEIIKSKIVIATLKNYFMESTSSTDYFYDCYEYERTSSN